MIFDPISDMLTRIRNASKVKKKEVVLPFSKIKMQIADLLVREGYLSQAEKIGGKMPNLKLHLKYDDGFSVINEIKRISKPGLRVYAGRDDLKLAGRGGVVRILSTSQGLMSDKEARFKKVGGEVICEVS